MSLAQSCQPRGNHYGYDGRSVYGRNWDMGIRATNATAATAYGCNYDNKPFNANSGVRNHDFSYDFSRSSMLEGPYCDRVWSEVVPSSKRRKISALSCDTIGRPCQQEIACENTLENHGYVLQNMFPGCFNAYGNAPLACSKYSAVIAATRSCASASALRTVKRGRSKFADDEEGVFMSREELERCSPSRKDGIDVLHETNLRYSYCAFLQNLGIRLDLPQTTIGTAMVLCHRFFVCRSHASHDRFLIATAALFLASKSEETPRPLNDLLNVSCEIVHKQEFALLSYMLPIDWFEQYRERIIEAEQLILTTLNFELNVQHPYDSLTSTLDKLGFSQSVLVNLALSLVSEGLRSSLWLQFKPHQIAAGAAYLAAKFLNMDLNSYHNVWHAFHTPPSVLKDVAHQLMELF